MRHRFHALCPYFAMFPEAFAEHWIDRLSKPGDRVLDPFAGRGTTPFQAILMDRAAVGNDINPVAYCATRAKTNAPALAVVKRRISYLRNRFSETEWRPTAEGLPEFFGHAYHHRTLAQILYLRDSLSWRTSDVDCMVAGLVLGSLHGESEKSPSYLSCQMPHIISTKPGYSVRFWKERGLQPPERDAFELLSARAEFRYRTGVPERRGEVHNVDMRELPWVQGVAEGEPIRLVVTSPPYLNITSFEEDQWLRIWFLGGEPRPTYQKISRDDRIEVPDRYWSMIADLWRSLSAILAEGGHVVIRFGARNSTPEALVARLEASSRFSARPVTLVSHDSSAIQNRQTNSFRPGSKGCRIEVDCHFSMA